MAQFDVYRLRGTYVLDCQSAILDQFDSRFVVPLSRFERETRPFPRLMPILPFEGDDHVMVTHLAGAVATRDLGTAIGSLATHRDAIIAALDMLVTGY